MRTRHLARLATDLLRYGFMTGRWWLPVATVVLSVAALLALTAQAVVTPVMYVLF